MINRASQLWRWARELDLSTIQETFERPDSLVVIASDEPLAEKVGRLFGPDVEGQWVPTMALGTAALGRRRATVRVVALRGSLDNQARRRLAELVEDPGDLVLIRWGIDDDMLVVGVPRERVVSLSVDDGENVARTRVIAALLSAAPDALLVLGRRYPGIREPVADHLVRDVARGNAQFAALSGLPGLIPLFGGLVGDMADLVVLTKNQLTLVFKLAGLYGRDLALSQQLLTEVLPVVGGAFFWRSAARSLVGLLPAPFALVPKAMVAYSGTFVVGQTARYYYRYRRRPPPDVARQIASDSVRLARTVLRRRGPP